MGGIDCGSAEVEPPPPSEQKNIKSCQVCVLSSPSVPPGEVDHGSNKHITCKRSWLQ